MSLQNLFTAIRKEDTALWIGAGFSMYAGYPSGRALQKILYAALNEEEKAEVGQDATLRKTAQALVTSRDGSENELIKILRSEYAKQPTTTHLHDLLSKIPHFHNIITTNYDTLLETSYSRRASLVRSAKDVPLINMRGTVIYKPHGDLSNTDTIVVTEDHYSSFYNLNRGDPFWTAIFDIIAKKTQLFLGYGFEDDNIWAWFEMIDKFLESEKKERFLIAPNWKDLQIKRLKKWNIEYIDMTGDQFINELNSILKLNVAADLENGMLSNDSYLEYMSFHQFDSGICHKGGKSKIISIRKTDKTPTLAKINFQVTDPLIANKLDKFNKGFGKAVKIEKDQLVFLDYFIEDFKMNMSLETIESLQIVRVPMRHSFSIEFPEEDFIIEDLVFESVQSNKKTFTLTCDVYGFKVQVNLTLVKNGNKVNFDFKIPDKLPSINKCVNFQKAIVYYFKGIKTLIKLNGRTYDITATNCEEYASHLEKGMEFYINLRKIEKFFPVSFEGAQLNQYSAKINTAKYLAELIDNKYAVLKFDAVALSVEGEVEEKKFRDLPKKFGSLLVKTGIQKDIELLGKKISLGEAGVEIEDIEVTSFNEEKTIVYLKSRKGRCLQRFSNISFFDVPDI